MNFRQILFVGFLSIFAGVIVGLILKTIIAWIGTMIICFAVLYAAWPWLTKKLDRTGTRDQRMATELAHELSEKRTAEGYSPSMANNPTARQVDIVEEFSREFSISSEKARALYNSGYKRWGDLSEAIPEDLMMVRGVNPTLARRIVAIVRQRNQQ